MKSALAAVVKGMAILAVGCWLLAVGYAGCGMAQEDELGAAAQAGQPQLTEAQRRQLLGNNFAALQNQQARVIVLQQLLNRELADLRQMQALFCDNYRLDVEKWRQGLYIYDDKTGQFVEKQVPEPKKEEPEKKKRGWGRKKR